jgi:hypothetical protein
VPHGFSLVHSGEPVYEVSATLPLLDSMGANMTKLEEVIYDQLEAEGHALVEQVTEHVVTCFQSQDPAVSLDLMMLGLVVGAKDVASSGVKEAAKAVAAWFQR